MRRAGDVHAPASAFPAQRRGARRHLAGLVTIREHNHLADMARQVESAKARGR
jgi:hypothetical protein